MSSILNFPKFSSSEAIQIVIKNSALIVMALYVAGLLVTNIHFMEIGIADFSALESRFVLRGVLFTVYVFVTCAIPLSLLLAGYYVYREVEGAFNRLAVGLVILFVWAALMIILGVCLNYVFCWGDSYESIQSRWMPTELPDTMRGALLLLKDAFWHLKIFLGILCLIAGGLSLTVRYERSRAAPSVISKFDFRNGAATGAGTYFSITAFALILFGYSQFVYPNLRYNFGGGQPAIVELFLNKEVAPIFSNLNLLDSADINVLKSVPVALWHQDASFYYVVPLDGKKGDRIQVFAMASNEVAAIVYRGGYIRIASKNKIREIRTENLR